MATSGCGSCGETFGTVTDFDAHQNWDRSTTPWTLTCSVPDGLVQDERGIWMTPDGLAARRATAERSRRRPESGVQGPGGITG